jgi:hypothetical protein
MFKIPDIVKTVFVHISTGIDGESFDIARIMGIVGVLFFMAMTVWNCLYKGQTFDYVNWGIGFGSVMGSMGIAIKLKEKTEPQT